MNKNDELTGTLVLVHPQLNDDPAGKQNRIGVITTADLENDNVFVSFGRDGQALYAANCLLVLQKPRSIHFNAMQNATTLETPDFKDLLWISVLAGSSLMKDRRQAMEMAKGNRLILEHSMAPLEDELGIRHVAGLERL
jgi:hypothetical protein